jgi:hypothetical protein
VAVIIVPFVFHLSLTASSRSSKGLSSLPPQSSASPQPPPLRLQLAFLIRMPAQNISAGIDTANTSPDGVARRLPLLQLGVTDVQVEALYLGPR